jgi:hypothetical protein
MSHKPEEYEEEVCPGLKHLALLSADVSIALLAPSPDQ